jgi:hypothetical protein
MGPEIEESEAVGELELNSIQQPYFKQKSFSESYAVLQMSDTELYYFSRMGRYSEGKVFMSLVADTKLLRSKETGPEMSIGGIRGLVSQACPLIEIFLMARE